MTVRSQVDGGLVYRDVFLADDAIGITISHTDFGDEYLAVNRGKTTSETVTEVTYRVQINEHFTIQPDVQYIVNSHNAGRNSVVAGVRAEISF